MDGKDYFKKLRTDKGYSIRQFANIADISPRLVTYYESGGKQIGSMSVEKSILVFECLNCSIVDFFDQYYSFKPDMDNKISEWKEKNKREYKFSVLKKRIYLRLAKIKERDILDQDVLNELFFMYEDYFNGILSEKCADGYLTEELYEKYVQKIFYRLKLAMNPLPGNDIGDTILDAIYKTDYSLSDVAKFCDITRQHLNRCITGNCSFALMHIDTALKLCYLLNLDFKRTFYFKKSYK